MIKNSRIKQIFLCRHTLCDMALKSLKAKYSNSILGISWAVVNPILIMLAVTFVFTAVYKITTKDFSLFVLAGIFPWMFFSSALLEASSSLINQQSVLRQFNLPREILPLASVLSNFMNFLIGWLVIYPLFLFFNPKIISLIPLLFIILLLNLIFVCGLGLMLAILNVFFRDLGHLLGVLLMFWFWVTPVFYSLDMVPARFRWICSLNPMSPYTVYYRDVIFNNSIPGSAVFLGVFFWAVLSLVLGFLSFACLEGELLKRI